MSSLTGADKIILEKLFKIDNGYVLNFSNSSFYSFISSYIGKFDWHDENGNGVSKAKRMRQLWSELSDYQCSNLLIGIAEAFFKEEDRNKIIQIASKIKKNNQFIINDNTDQYEYLPDFIKQAQEDLEATFIIQSKLQTLYTVEK